MKWAMIDETLDQDPATDALDHLADVAKSSAAELHDVENGLHQMSERRQRGWTWRQIIATSDGTSVLAHCTRITATLASAMGAFRRGLATSLHREGMPVTSIAEVFEVSRQRVSTLINSKSSAQVD